jgi:hypothetical protein
LFLDEFVALTGYHRKHAIRVLNRPQSIRQLRSARGLGSMTRPVRHSLIVLWEAADRICGKRLRRCFPRWYPP